MQEFFAALLGQDAQETRVLLSELADGLDNLPAPEALWTKRLLSRYPRDQSATAALVLQLVRLEAGEGLYLGAGELHAYLSGTGLEIMANSDNVLRGGLTPKHVDASELLRVLRFTHAPVQVLSAEGCGPVRHYKTPCKEFALARLTLGSSEQTEYQPASPCAQIWLCLGDGAELQWGTAGTLTIRRGEAVFVTANTPKITVRTKPGESCDLWLAGYETSP